MSYEIGSKARSTVTVTDLTGAPADATMSIVVIKPDGTAAATPSIVDDTGLGNYYADIPLTAAGVWTIVWTAAGAIIAVYTNQLTVRAPGMRIISLAEAKAHLNKDLTITTDDDELRGFIDATQVVIEGEIGPVVPVSKLEYYTGRGRWVVLRRRPVVAITLVREQVGSDYFTIIPETPPGTDLDYRLDRGMLLRRINMYPALWRGDVEVTYSAGRNPIPGNIALAAKEELAHLWRNSQLSKGGARAAAGADDVLSSLAFSLPHRVSDLLSKSKRAPRTGGA